MIKTAKGVKYRILDSGAISMIRPATSKLYWQIRYGNDKRVCNIEDWLARWEKKKELIKENCKPQEVYFVEYNNLECMLDFDGDEEAWNDVVDIFGEERCKKEIKRITTW